MTVPSGDAEGLFAYRMRRRREELGLSTRALADHMRERGFEWHHTTVQRTESAKRPVRLSEATSIAAILRTDLQALLRPKIDPSLIAQLEEELAEYVHREKDLRAKLDSAEAEAAEAEQQLRSADRQRKMAEDRVKEFRMLLEQSRSHILENEKILAALRNDLMRSEQWKGE